MADEYGEERYGDDEAVGQHLQDADAPRTKDIEDVDLGPVRGYNAGGDFSIVDAFREELRELSEAKDVYIPVKGYERIGLQIRYHTPEHGKEIATLAQKVAREAKDTWSRNLLISMDMMIHLCDGFYVQPEGVEQPVML